MHTDWLIAVCAQCAKHVFVDCICFTFLRSYFILLSLLIAFWYCRVAVTTYRPNYSTWWWCRWWGRLVKAQSGRDCDMFPEAQDPRVINRLREAAVVGKIDARCRWWMVNISMSTMRAVELVVGAICHSSLASCVFHQRLSPSSISRSPSVSGA